MSCRSVHPMPLLLACGALFLGTKVLPAQQAGGSPVKIFILTGQSNMVNHRVRHFTEHTSPVGHSGR